MNSALDIINNARQYISEHPNSPIKIVGHTFIRYVGTTPMSGNEFNFTVYIDGIVRPYFTVELPLALDDFDDYPLILGLDDLQFIQNTAQEFKELLESFGAYDVILRNYALTETGRVIKCYYDDGDLNESIHHGLYYTGQYYAVADTSSGVVRSHEEKIIRSADEIENLYIRRKEN